MPILVKYVYVTTKYMGYLSAIKQFGPIAHPAKITEDEANALSLAGVDLIVHDPITKMTRHWASDIQKKEITKSISAPVKETILSGVPKSAGDFGISEQKVVEPKTHIDIKEILTESETTVNESIEDEKKEPQVVTKMSVDETIAAIKSNALTENDIMWSNYTKSERRQIKNAINNKNNN